MRYKYTLTYEFYAFCGKIGINIRIITTLFLKADNYRHMFLAQKYMFFLSEAYIFVIFHPIS